VDRADALVVRSRINQWLLTLRKHNAAVVLATQSPAQLEQLPFRHTVLDSCPTKIYLPNPDAITPGQSNMYRELGLNAREIASIAKAVPKRHYYFKSPRGSRLFELGLGPATLAFLAGCPGATVDETKRAVSALIDEFGAEWVPEWLARIGLPAWSSRLAQHLESIGHSPSMPTMTLASVSDARTSPRSSAVLSR